MDIEKCVIDAPIVYIVDDDESIRRSLVDLLASIGLCAVAFEAAQDFIRAERRDTPNCLVLDIRMPGISGLDFQQELISLGIEIPTIFISAHGDIPMSVKAMKAGAVDFLTKPFREQDLLDAIHLGLDRDRRRRRDASVKLELRKLYESLSRGEREVMDFVVSGLLNKQIAARLSVSEVTVKVRRSQLMRKMRADSLASLVRMSELIHEDKKKNINRYGSFD